MKTRTSVEKDRPAILHVHQEAFGGQKGATITQLVARLFDDRTARPSCSLVAVADEMIAGHILFTNVTIDGAGEEIAARILAPLAVLPAFQQRGVGSGLVEAGLAALRKSGVRLVFVLGHPGYYPRHGFSPAGKHGFEAPFPIPERHADAWMVQELFPGIIGQVKGKVQCCNALNEPEHWRE